MSDPQRPAVKASVAAVELDGELVVLDLDAGSLHHLDPLATVIWACLDGTGTVAEIVTDLAEVFGADQDMVETDVVALVERLDAEGLLASADASAQPAPAKQPPLKEDQVRVRPLTDPPSP